MPASVSWVFIQWLPLSDSMKDPWQDRVFERWERNLQHKETTEGGLGSIQGEVPSMDVPFVDVQPFLDDLDGLERHVVDSFGSDWRKRPLLLKGLWNATDLASPTRRISLQGLQQETKLVIPYFSNATDPSALSPDAKGTVADIVRNMTNGHPHKIGSQWYIQTYPERIAEVAPVELVTKLFGNFFTPDKLQSRFLVVPAMTTVPMFVAHTKPLFRNDNENDDPPHPHPSKQQTLFTNLHCEPIGNVAVQLHGSKQWTLVQPEHSTLLRPAMSKDGRAFVYAGVDQMAYGRVPTYQVVTRPGDGLWVPTWTWHRVDYVSDEEEVALAASLFHFRPLAYVINNPLLALSTIPAIVKELLGLQTQ